MSSFPVCHLFHLPQDIFRVIFQYLYPYELMKGEEAFLNNQELLSLYRSALKGFTLKEELTIPSEDEKIIPWIIDHKLLIEKLQLRNLKDLEMDLLNYIRSSLKSIYFSQLSSRSVDSIPVIPPLGHFPSLTSVEFCNSNYFTNDQLLSFFSHNPQLEIVRIEEMPDLSNEIISHLSNSCPNIKIFSLFQNYWVDDETMSLLSQQRLFPNLKSLNIHYTSVRDYESLRQFILSHPLLSGLYFPHYIQYSDEFLLFYLRQVVFPSILSHNNHNDLESHSLAITSLLNCFVGGILDGRNDVVNPEIFSLDILSHLYYKGFPRKTLYETTQIFYHLSEFSSMIDSILQSQFIPFILHDMRPNDSLPFDYFVDLLFNCDTRLFSLLTTEELQTIIQIVLNESHKVSTYKSLKIISTLLQKPSSQDLVDPKNLLMLFKKVDFSNFNGQRMIECLGIFISVNENYQQLLIESNLIPQIMKKAESQYLISFTHHCLASSGDGLLVDHLVDSGLFQKLLSNYYKGWSHIQIEALFKVIIEFKNNKYSEIVRGIELPDELRVKLFEKGEKV